MQNNRITIDAHALIWYVDKLLNNRLSLRAIKAIGKAESEGHIFIPAIILLEIKHLVERGRIDTKFEDIISFIEKGSNFTVIPIDLKILRIAFTLEELEIHDRLVVATAINTNSILIAKDREIQQSGINVLW